MKNIIGPPAEGKDFFGRQKEINRFLNLLAEGSLNLTAPRRVGKTSLVLEVCSRWQKKNRPATFLNVEDCTDEIVFTERLLESVESTAYAQGGLRKWAQKKLRRIRRTSGNIKVGPTGVDMELDTKHPQEQDSLAVIVGELLSTIEKGNDIYLIAIDELPEMLRQISKQENGIERVAKLLHWMRMLRQTHRQRTRWVFLGSIGLDGFADQHGLGKTINDLTIESLSVFSNSEALELLSSLADEYGISMAKEAKTRVLERVGWLLPYHLQLVFHSLRKVHVSTSNSENSAKIDTRSVDEAFEDLLQPQNYQYFDTWRQRLHEQYEIDDASLAQKILNTVSRSPTGLSRENILNATINPNSNPQSLQDRVAGLLTNLEREGYLMFHGGCYAFRSPILREYWYRRHIR